MLILFTNNDSIWTLRKIQKINFVAYWFYWENDFFLIRFGETILTYLKIRAFYTIRIFFLIAGFLLLNTARSQSYQFSKYSVEQGLPQQYIYSLNQDQNGFIWIGTGDGI